MNEVIYPQDLMKDPRFINQSRNERKANRFYVKFPDLPENVSNFLGSQIINITRPRYAAGTFQTARRNNKYQNLASWELQPVNVTFSEDANGFVELLLTNQILRQVNQLPDINGQTNAGNDADFKFDMEVELYDENQKVTSKYILKDCFIAEFEPEPLTTAGKDNDLTIDCVIYYDAVKLKIYEQWVELSRKA